jgi:putative ABC transport system permease protein
VDWAGHSQVFESLGVSAGNGYTLTGRGDPAMLLGQMASPGVFQTLGVPAALGRTFLPEEAQAGRDHVVVLGHALWREKFGADPNIVGQPVVLNSETYTVVGVMPAGFDYPAPTFRLWVPAALSSGSFQKFKDAHMLRVIGRLKPGIGTARLEAELDGVTHRIAERDPGSIRRLLHAPLQEAATGEIRRPLIVIMCAVGFVLLIAYANVANLLLARATARQREMAVRAAMGAGRLRLMRQLLVESVVVSIVGGLFGFLLAVWGIDALIAFSPANLPGIQNTHIDVWVLGFTILVSVGTGLLFGLAPALTTWNSDWNEVLKQGSRGAAGGPGSRLRGALVAAEVALSLVLLTSSGLMLRSFLRLQSVNPGFRAENVLTASMALREARYTEAANIIAFDRALLEKLRSLPGVESVATNTALPFSGHGWGNGVAIEGHPSRAGEARVAQVQCISTRYFTSMGIPLMRGRDFEERDSEKSLPVAIISESMAKAYWPGEDPIGKRLEVDGPLRTVVGIIGDVKKTGLDANEQPQLYIPYVELDAALLKFLGRGIFIAVRTSINPTSVAAAVRAQVHELDPEMALVNVTTMQHMLYESVAQPRFRTWLIGIFSAVALLWPASESTG